MDSDMIEKLADSAQSRADQAHKRALDDRPFSLCACEFGEEENTCSYHSHLNDWAYWIGHANAYRGVLAGLAIQKMVEEEKEEEGSCP